MRVHVLVVGDDGLVCGLDPVGGRLDVDVPRLLPLQAVRKRFDSIRDRFTLTAPTPLPSSGKQDKPRLR